MRTGLGRGVSVLARTVIYLSKQAVHGHPRRDPSGPRRFRELLQSQGGIYVKLGQLLSLQRDVLPRDYCTALFDLLDRMPEADPASIERVIEQELGLTPSACFDRFDPVPIASASIAQVHVAYLDGRKLAVKVRRPGVEEVFASDLRLLGAVARWIGRLRIHSLAWFARVIGELELWTREELDFRNEARYQRALAKLTSRSAIQHVPEVVESLSTDRVLVSEFLEGPTLLQLIRELEREGSSGGGHRQLVTDFDAEQLADRVVDTFVGNALENGLFHADLHPANLLVLPGNVLGFVDFGITGALSLHARRKISGLILAMTENDPRRLVDQLFELSTFDDRARPGQFRAEIEEAMRHWYESETGRMTTSFSSVMIDILRVCRRNGILGTPDTIRYLRSVIGAEGLVHRFAPAYDVAGALARACGDQLATSQIQDRLDPGRVGGMISSLARALPRLPAVASGLGTTAETVQGLSTPRSRAPRRRAIGLASIAFGCSLVAVSIDSPAPGVNLFSVTSLAAVACWLGWLPLVSERNRGR